MHRSALTRPALAAMFIASYLGAAATGQAGGYDETDLVVNKSVNGVPTLTDKNGIKHIAKVYDPDLKNPWGISESSTSPFWVSDNGSGKSTLYNAPALGGFSKNPRVVSIPSPGDPLGASGKPTGTVFNTTSQAPPAQQGFKISGFNCTTLPPTPTSAPASFLFATEDGTIVGWSNNVFATAGCQPNHGIIAVDNSNPANPASGAIYKGLAIATTAGGATYLYAANFRAGTVEIYDVNFHLVNTFTDPSLPASYAPFNVVPIGGELFVTFAMRNSDKEDDVAGQGHGFVDTFDLTGEMIGRFAQHGQLDSPWGVALAPPGFGALGGLLWIGNFGNGHVNAYNFETGEFVDKVRDAKGQAIVIDGLWALKFGNGGNGGDPNVLYFTAGPNNEADGLFGSLKPH